MNRKTLLAALIVCSLGSVCHAKNRVIGGTTIEASNRPEVVKVEINGSSCSGTVVGPRVVLTAGHCGDSASAVTVETVFGDYRGTFVRHPDYPKEDKDIALIVTDKKMNNIPPASIISGAINVGDLTHLLGYGCTGIGGGGPLGQLVLGEAHVTHFTGYDVVTDGAALCFGDSGGPAYVIREGRYELAGIGSKGDIKKTSYFTRFDLDDILSFLESSEQLFQQKICGLNSTCAALHPVVAPSVLEFKNGFKSIKFAGSEEIVVDLNSLLKFGNPTSWFLSPDAPAWALIKENDGKQILSLDMSKSEQGVFSFVVVARSDHRSDSMVFEVNTEE